MLILHSGEQQILLIIYDLFPFSKENLKSTAHSVPSLFNLNSCTTTKSNCYFANSVATALIILARTGT